jgi:cell division protein FtsZ
MIESGVAGVKFVVANTDAQALENSKCENIIQLGTSVTQGLGAGSYPEVGKAAAEESMDEILDYLQGSNMVFVTAGMGGGTGTGAAPVIAQLAREQGILTVGVVTKPFHFEGSHRMRIGELGLQELQKYVDTMIVIPNQNLFRVADKNTTFLDAFKLADGVLKSGVKGITDLMVMPGLINLDFSDVRSVMSEMGKAMMGTGEAEGENRSIKAAEAAIANPLLDNVSMQGARGVLINITGGSDMTLFEVDEAANRIREEVDENANIIFGSTFDNDLDGKMRVSVVATGIDSESQDQPAQNRHSGSSGFVASQSSVSPQKASFSKSSESDEGEDDDSGESFFSREPVDPENAGNTSYERSSQAKSTQSSGDSSVFSNYGSDSASSASPSSAKAQADDFKRPGRAVPPQSSGSGGGLFGSLFSKKEGLPTEDNLESENNDEEDNGDNISNINNTSPKQSSNEEELDIPAFMRRNKG